MPSRTYTYLLPVANKYYDLKKAFIKDAYLAVENVNDTYDYNLYALMPNNRNLPVYESYISNTFETISYDKSTIVVIPYPEKEHYELYVKGQYSKFTEENKQTILDYFKLTPLSNQWKILYKYEGYRKELEDKLNIAIPKENELGERVTLKQETLNVIN